jgi:hypothetical protein
MFLLDDILLAPAKGLYSVFKVIADRVDEEMYNPEKIQEELMQLQLKFEMDEISEEEYDQLEEQLLERLEESSERRKQG